MAKLRYVGPHDAVIVPMHLGGEQYVARGAIIDVGGAQAQLLLEQPANWEAAEEEKKDKAEKVEKVEKND